MKAELVEQLRCPACGSDHALRLCVQELDAREVREGLLRCSACAREFAVRRGVPELLHDPQAHILTEAAGLERFAEHMRLGGWDRELVRRLPDVEHGYWYVQARSMHQLLTTVPFRPGQTVLDVGSNTCWASNHFAERGLRAIALDIATTELQGLYTAEYFLENGHVFFERILGSMDAIPLGSSSIDYVYCCEVLHHNDPAGLRRTLQEIFRVLRPGGRLLMVNETLRTLRDPSGMHLEGVEQYEGYEHANPAYRYRWEATRAGFFTEVTEPHYRSFFGDAELALPPNTPALRAAAARAGFALRPLGLARRVYLWWLNNIWGGVSMNMIATKPTRYVGRHEPMPAGERLARTALAGARLKVARLRRSPSAPQKLPRTPEQAAAAAHPTRR
ncbi:MAG TPA: class I SAM-dependent methyltransferase [Solirubrobacteraceae bacterium]|nr:class I SAM-dependent methyltransferase [Solirubrobacteraceae bacterium]